MTLTGLYQRMSSTPNLTMGQQDPYLEYGASGRTRIFEYRVHELVCTRKTNMLNTILVTLENRSCILEGEFSWVSMSISMNELAILGLRVFQHSCTRKSNHGNHRYSLHSKNDHNNHGTRGTRKIDHNNHGCLWYSKIDLNNHAYSNNEYDNLGHSWHSKNRS